jgi:hypothetical protein
MVERADGSKLPGVRIRCPRCKHMVDAFGRSPASVRRCLAQFRESCPRREKNFYQASEWSPRS